MDDISKVLLTTISNTLLGTVILMPCLTLAVNKPKQVYYSTTLLLFSPTFTVRYVM